ncbi:TrbG/VirB9 family P-type conjugative transfer protein [Rhodanobacter sp. 115]|uniref:TrbG/VirB9 family P-type conjugative transfer protein n=1 Tax=Rhodanobacter sp. FW021-MT20 TaxID=1162282 RepID=UPI0034E5702D
MNRPSRSLPRYLCLAALLGLVAGVPSISCARGVAQRRVSAQSAENEGAFLQTGGMVDATPVINNSRMVSYTWSSSRSYAVRSLAGMNTDIEVPSGEKLYGFYLSNASDWSFEVTKDQKRVLIKPAQPGLYNTALMVTNKRSYQLTLISVAPNALWFQRVEWRIPTDTQAGGNGVYISPSAPYANAGTAVGGNSQARAAAAVPPLSVDPSKIYTRYEVSGRAAFKPLDVFDDGVRTWMRFPEGMQDMPAIFAITDGKLDVVDYSVADGYVIVPRVAAKFVLSLNGAKVKIERGCNPERCLK